MQRSRTMILMKYIFSLDPVRIKTIKRAPCRLSRQKSPTSTWHAHSLMKCLYWSAYSIHSWRSHCNYHYCWRHTGLHPGADLFSHMQGEVSAIPPRPVIVCSAVKCEYEQRPGRNITLFKGFSCSTECCLLMTFGCVMSNKCRKGI